MDNVQIVLQGIIWMSNISVSYYLNTAWMLTSKDNVLIVKMAMISMTTESAKNKTMTIVILMILIPAQPAQKFVKNVPKVTITRKIKTNAKKYPKNVKK